MGVKLSQANSKDRQMRKLRQFVVHVTIKRLTILLRKIASVMQTAKQTKTEAVSVVQNNYTKQLTYCAFKILSLFLRILHVCVIKYNQICPLPSYPWNHAQF